MAINESEMIYGIEPWEMKPMTPIVVSDEFWAALVAAYGSEANIPPVYTRALPTTTFSPDIQAAIGGTTFTQTGSPATLGSTNSSWILPVALIAGMVLLK